MHKAFKFRVFPTPEQQAIIATNIGCNRFVYNYFLAERKNLYQTEGINLSFNKCSSRLAELKQRLPWLYEADSTSLQASLRHLDEAFKKFFRREAGYPLFKRKKFALQSYTSKNSNGRNIRVVDNKISLPKLGWVSFAKSRDIEGRILHATIRYTKTGKYFVSVLCDVEKHPLPYRQQRIRVEEGTSEFATLSTGEQVGYGSLQKCTKQYNRWERRLSRRKLGGRNYERARSKVTLLREKLENCKQDFLHKLSTRLIRENQTVFLVESQIKKAYSTQYCSGKYLHQELWPQFRKMTEYKAAWYERRALNSSKVFPNVKLCTMCGHRRPEVKRPELREWTCYLHTMCYDSEELMVSQKSC